MCVIKYCNNPATILKPFPNHNHHGLNWVKKEGSDSGFGGQAWVSIKMTNNLAAGVYTAVFETFSALIYSPTNINILNNETLLQDVHGNGGNSIITFSHDYQTTHSKAFIQFTSDGQPGEITFQIRYYGSSYNNSRLNFLFYSRVVAGRVGAAFNHALFDVDDVQYENQILYFEDLNLNGNKIKSLADPTENKDAVHKKYVDDKIKAIPAVDTLDLLKLDGSRALTGDLNMNDKNIIELETRDDVPITDYPNNVKDSKMAVNKGYANEHFLKLDSTNNYFDLKQKVIKNTEPFYDGLFGDNDSVSKAFVDAEIAKLPKAPSTSDLLKSDGTRAMTGNLKMGDNTITGIKRSAVDNAALTVGGAKATYLPLSGNRAMGGNLNLGGFRIMNIKPFVEDDSSQSASDTKKNDVVNWGKIHQIRGDLKREINTVASDALNRKNPDPVEDPIDMGNHFITNVRDPLPSISNYATTVNFVNKTVLDNNATISTLIDSKINEVEDLNIKSAKQVNVFSFIMDDDLFKEDDSDITKVGKVNKDFYDIHKETGRRGGLMVSALVSGSTGPGSSPGQGHGVVLLGKIREYTFVFELYYDKNKVKKKLVVVEAQSVPLNISKNTTKTFDNHSRTIINRAAMGRARFIIYPCFIINRAAMGRARFMFYPWCIFFFRVERPRPPLGRIKDSRESRNLRCLFAKSF